MKLPILGTLDERFLEHRRRASSVAGMTCAALALVLCYYRFLVDRVLRWDLAAVALTFLVIKYALFAWYRLKD